MGSSDSRHSRTFSAGILWSLLIGALSSCAAAPLRPDTMPTLTTLEGNSVTLPAVLSKAAATVLIFFATDCPCVTRYQQRMERWANTLTSDSAQVFYVSSNAADDRAALQEAIATRHLQLPMLIDPQGTLARELQVRSTPTVVVFDRTGALRFRGWFDNERLPLEPGREAWVETAVDQLLAGQTGFTSSAPMWGCVITRRLNSSH